MKKCIQWYLAPVPLPLRTEIRPTTSAPQDPTLNLKELATTKTFHKTKTEIQPTTSATHDPTLNLKELAPKKVKKNAQDGVLLDLYGRVI